jgi:predicted DsbA family dithiol-disulfide isomerase
MDRGLSPLRVRVHYDFASSLCYVAHRVMQRMSGALDELGVELAWSPLDLSQLCGPYAPGVEIPEARRANAQRVGEELGVALRVPRVWPDASALNAVALCAERAGRGASWRERAFSALFEEQRPAPDDANALALAREIELHLDACELSRARGELELKTELAREEQVTGVPTFMLGAWPFGGIQTEDTMSRVLERYARKQRAGELA